MNYQIISIENKKNLFECISQCYLTKDISDICDIFNTHLISLFGHKDFAFGTWNSISNTVHTLYTTLEDSPTISQLTMWNNQPSPLIRYSHDADVSSPSASNFLLHGYKDSLDNERSFMMLAKKTEPWNRRDELLANILSLPIHKAIRNALRISIKLDNKILTDREKQVLYWCHLGKTNSEIGILLRISSNTVKNHVSNIFKKLNVQNKAQAVVMAANCGLLEASVV